MPKHAKRLVAKLILITAALTILPGQVQAVRDETSKVTPTFLHGKVKVTVLEPTVMAPSPGNTQGKLPRRGTFRADSEDTCGIS